MYDTIFENPVLPEKRTPTIFSGSGMYVRKRPAGTVRPMVVYGSLVVIVTAVAESATVTSPGSRTTVLLSVTSICRRFDR